MHLPLCVVHLDIVGKVMRIPTIVHDFDTQVYFPYPLYLRIADRPSRGPPPKRLRRLLIASATG
jgi:hypothetical protein